MKKWILKAFIQKGISLLPFSHRLNYLFQRYITKGVFLSDAYFEDKLIHFRHHRQWVQPQGNRILELGTGWYPVIPLFYFLEGAAEVQSIDLSPLTNDEAIRLTAKKFLEWKQSGKLNEVHADDQRWNQLKELSETQDVTSCLNQMGIHLMVGDASSTKHTSGYFGGIVSNNTFEHIYPEALEQILKAFYRITDENGKMSHFIDMSDHFAHLDREINIYHFLKFSERSWNLIDNSVQPQNRWRLVQYRNLLQKCGFRITEEIIRPGDLEALRMVPVDASFQPMGEKELAISHAYLFVRK